MMISDIRNCRPNIPLPICGTNVDQYVRILPLYQCKVGEFDASRWHHYFITFTSIFQATFWNNVLFIFFEIPPTPPKSTLADTMVWLSLNIINFEKTWHSRWWDCSPSKAVLSHLSDIPFDASQRALHHESMITGLSPSCQDIRGKWYSHCFEISENTLQIAIYQNPHHSKKIFKW